MQANPTENAGGAETIESLREKIEHLTNSAHTMCGRAEDQGREMQKYVKKSAHLEQLMSALDNIISSKENNMGFKEIFDRLVADQPEHKKLISELHTQLMKLQENQHDISTESSKIAEELVNLNHKNNRAHQKANVALEQQVRKGAIISKMMQVGHDSTKAKNVTVSNEFIEKVRTFVEHVEKMVNCKMDKENVFQIICAEINAVKAGVNEFDAHVKTPYTAPVFPKTAMHGPATPTPTYLQAANPGKTLGRRSLPPPRQVTP
jgi:DNA repair exonuclease SbcCD ATPase subunit